MRLLLCAALIVCTTAMATLQAQDAVARTYIAALKAFQDKQWAVAEAQLKSVIDRRATPAPEIRINNLGARGPKYIPLFYLARVYLAQQRFAEAAELLDKIYADGGYRGVLDAPLMAELIRLRDEARLQDASAMNARVVRIVVEPADRSASVGAGVIIGFRGDVLDVAVPLHVLTGAPDPAEPGSLAGRVRQPRSISVSFHGAAGRTAPGTWAGNFDAGLDLATIRVPRPPHLELTPLEFHATAPGAATAVMTVGHYPVPWSRMTHTVLNRHPDETDLRKFTISPQGLQPGASGGIVIDAQGHLLGMMLQLRESAVDVVGATQIEGLAHAWGASTQYLDQLSADRDRTH